MMHGLRELARTHAYKSNQCENCGFSRVRAHVQDKVKTVALLTNCFHALYGKRKRPASICFAPRAFERNEGGLR